MLVLHAGGCGAPPPQPPVATTQEPAERLSQYGLFQGEIAALVPAEGVIPYDLNSPLFTDYALKYRVVKLPAGAHATYRSGDAFDFPVGTVIAKTFAIPRDARISRWAGA